MSFEEVTIGSARLIRGDCREVLPTLDSVDAVVTDPPYGVGLGVANDRRRNGHGLGKERYDTSAFQDTEDHLQAVTLPVVRDLIARFGRVVLTPGAPHCFRYPKPTSLGSIFYPAGAGRCSWGFVCSQPVLFYGRDPHRATRPNAFSSTERAERNGHPCPKPIGVMRWLVDRASKDGELTLDPFMGSGSTGVACAQLGRRFIGIEIEPRYFDIACARIAAVQAAAAA